MPRRTSGQRWPRAREAVAVHSRLQAVGNEWSDEQAAMLECTLLQEVEARDTELTEQRQTIAHLRYAPATSAPGLAHICAGTGPHLRRDWPTSAPGLARVCPGTVRGYRLNSRKCCAGWHVACRV
jgi:hypothetical protein